MRKTLLTFLLGTSLVFGVNSLKAQKTWDDYKQVDLENTKNSAISLTFNNDDADDFKERILILKQEYAGLTIIYYNDENNDNFHETIKEFNYDLRCDTNSAGQGNIIKEEFYVNKNLGFVDYKISKYKITCDEWLKYYSGKLGYPDMVLKDNEENLEKISSEDKYELTEKSLEDNPEFKIRIKRMVDAGKNSDENFVDLKKFVERERYYWKEKFKKQIENKEQK